MESLRDFFRASGILRGGRTVPALAWYIIFVSTVMISLAIVLKPAPEVDDEFGHVADTDLEAFLEPAAGGNADEPAQAKERFSLSEKMQQRLGGAK